MKDLQELRDSLGFLKAEVSTLYRLTASEVA